MKLFRKREDKIVDVDLHDLEVESGNRLEHLPGCGRSNRLDSISGLYCIVWTFPCNDPAHDNTFFWLVSLLYLF